MGVVAWPERPDSLLETLGHEHERRQQHGALRYFEGGLWAWYLVARECSSRKIRGMW